VAVKNLVHLTATASFAEFLRLKTYCFDVEMTRKNRVGTAGLFVSANENVPLVVAAPLEIVSQVVRLVDT